ncbi:MAG: hypothetical protein ACP5LQ_09030 [Candidatus Methanodesulfokora sp.]
MRIKVGINLELTLYPSFVLSLFHYNNGTYVKAAGIKKECKMRAEDGYLVTDCGDEALYWSGAWFMDLLDSEEPKGSISWLVDLLKSQYPTLGLAVDPHDPLHILIPIFLSQSTSYHGNVVRWSRRLWEETDDPFKAAEIAPKLSGSYQLRRLNYSFSCLSSAISGDVWTTRRKMVNCRYCGPKVADAFLLFGMAETTSAPVDRHFISMARKLELWDFRQPILRMCRKNDCHSCPANKKCIRWLSFDQLGKLAGWIQTAFYLHEKLYCSRKLCQSCLIRSECNAKS